MRLRVMTYNFLYAFHERDGDSMVLKEGRARAARDVVRAAAPDILGITEAVYCGVGRGKLIRPDYGEMFGLEHVHAAGFEGDWGNCIASRFPILRTEVIPLGGGRKEVLSSALRVTLEVEGREVHVDVVHPSPMITESQRVQAFVPVLTTFQRPYLMIGDFNALSDEDPYDHATMVSEMTGNVDDPAGLATRMLDRKLIASVRAHGLQDFAPPGRRHTLPTRLPRPHATQGARLRLDYIFGSEEFRAERVEVIDNELSDRVSDHYPLVADLELH
ncbi:MAG: endonuclease/exonuclease/phosphatase family protein [Archangium sp.]|nr:endonuclease/exonuclease/phosphatase family protein [Archangium sp.]